MSRVTEIKFERVAKISATGFENVKVSYTATLSEGDDPKETFEWVRALVDTQIVLSGGIIPCADAEPTEDETTERERRETIPHLAGFPPQMRGRKRTEDL